VEGMRFGKDRMLNFLKQVYVRNAGDASLDVPKFCIEIAQERSGFVIIKLASLNGEGCVRCFGYEAMKFVENVNSYMNTFELTYNQNVKKSTLSSFM
jgi:hypothetical protein